MMWKGEKPGEQFITNFALKTYGNMGWVCENVFYMRMNTEEKELWYGYMHVCVCWTFYLTSHCKQTQHRTSMAH